MFLTFSLDLYLTIKIGLQNKILQVSCGSDARILYFALTFKSPETEVIINGFMSLNQRCDCNLYKYIQLALNKLMRLLLSPVGVKAFESNSYLRVDPCKLYSPV